MTPWRSCVLLAVLAAALFGANLGGYDLWAPDEPRFAEAAREMRASGDYLVPRVNGETYLEKPPLLFWAIALASEPFGEVTPLTARIPSVIAGVVTVVFTFLIALRLFSPRIAFWAGVVLMTCMRVWWNARCGQIDMLLTACTTVACYALCRWDGDRRKAWLLLLYGALTAGMLAKGPPVLVCPFLFLFFFYRRDKAARKATLWPWGLAAAVALTALWYVPARLAAAETGAGAAGAGMADNLFRNTIGRMFLGVSKAQWPWYYLTTVPVDLLPWSLFLPWTLPWAWKRCRTVTGVRFLWYWIVPAFIFFSICVGKRQIYLLPLFPAFAILLAASLEDFVGSLHSAWRSRTGLAWGVALVLAGLAPAALPWTEYSEAWGLPVLAAMALTVATRASVDHSCLPMASASARNSSSVEQAMAHQVSSPLHG